MGLHRNLQTVVDWTWQNRAELMRIAVESTHRPKGRTHLSQHNRAIGKIYGYISSENPANPEDRVSRSTMDSFRRVLSNELQSKLPGVTSKIQSHEWKEMKSVSDFPNWDEWIGSFIHYRTSQRVQCKERVYINLKEKTRASAFATILKKIWDIPGLYAAKVAAPGARKCDTVVIYCDSSESRKAVIEEVKKHQRRRQSHFASELPRLVAPDGFGIGHGAEPPTVHPQRVNSQSFELVRAKEGQSFGLYRAELIFIALERTQFPENMNHDCRRAGMDLRRFQNANRRHGMQLDIEGEQKRKLDAVAQRAQKTEFEVRVGEVFRLAGLNPEHPETQGAVIVS